MIRREIKKEKDGGWVFEICEYSKIIAIFVKLYKYEFKWMSHKACTKLSLQKKFLNIIYIYMLIYILRGIEIKERVVSKCDRER